MTAAGLKELEAMRQLTGLCIVHCDLPDKAIAQLRKKLPHLKPPPPQPLKPLPNDTIEPTFDVVKIPVLFKVSRRTVRPQDDVIRRLNKERFNAAFDAVEQQFKSMQSGTAVADTWFLDHVDGLLDAALALGDFPERTLILDGAMQLALLARETAEGQFAAGKIGLSDLAAVRYHQATMELRVLEARGQAKAK